MKIVQSDIFVFSDDVQYSKQQLINRANFKSSLGNKIHLVLPVSKTNDNRIIDKSISRNDLRVFQKGINKLKVSYRDCDYYLEMEPLIEFVEGSVQEIEKLSD